MQHFKTIVDYCKGINISAPKQAFFDIRTFSENMTTVVPKMPPFKHEFYAIAIKVEGMGKVKSGHHTDFPDGATVFFNSPFQVLSWEIVPNWKGYYLMFSKEFITQSRHLQRILSEFPFLKIDTSVPFEIKPEEVSTLLTIYETIYKENKDLKPDSNRIIEAQLLVLLNYVHRFFNAQTQKEEAIAAFRKADINLISRFQTLLETSFYDTQISAAKTHSPSHYAKQLAIHPNHLNAIVKQVTGHTAKAHIHRHLLRLAKARLIQTDMSIKEIAYALHFDAPNNFSSFFKKYTALSPNAFRKKGQL